MGRRSRFTPAQKREAVLAVLMKHNTVSGVCRELQVSETSFNRWREQALEASMKRCATRPSGTRATSSWSGAWLRRSAQSASSLWRTSCGRSAGSS
jgi:transposase-like protein